MRNIQRVHSLFLLIATVAMEAEGESYLGKLAVAFVIVNRAEYRGKSISDVVFEPYAFSVWNSRGGRRQSIDDINDEVWTESEKAAFSAYYGIEADPIFGADHYLNEELTRQRRGDGRLPSWVSRLTFTRKIDQHTFYSSRPYFPSP